MGRERRGKSKDASHYEKAFAAGAKTARLETEYEEVKSTATRTHVLKRLMKARCDENAKLAALTQRDQALTRVTGEFLRRNSAGLDAEGEVARWLEGDGRVELGTYSEFDRWCGDKRNELDTLGRQRTAAEAQLANALDEISKLDLRTIQIRFQNHHASRSNRGRPRKKN
jgi:hypothetical protein